MNKNNIKLIPLVISLVIVSITIYLISLSRYPGWVWGVLQNGGQYYDLSKELIYVIPYIGPYLTIFDMIAIHTSAGSLGYITYHLFTKQFKLSEFVRKYKVSIMLTIISIVFIVIGLSIQDCFIGIDTIMSTLFNNAVAKYISLGPMQFIFLSIVLSLYSTYNTLKVRNSIKYGKSNLDKE